MVADDIRAFVPTSEASTYFYYFFGNSRISLGSDSSRLYCSVKDDNMALGENHARFIWNGDTSKYHIATMQLDTAGATNLKLQYNNTDTMEGAMTNYNIAHTYNAAPYWVGWGNTLAGPANYLSGNVQEVIVFNRALNSTEINTVQNYFNNKYKIY